MTSRTTQQAQKAQKATSEDTRDEILRLLHERSERSAAELAEEIGVSDGSVRRHLDVLVASGVVDARLERRPRGRPVSRYALTEAGEEAQSGEHYQRLLQRISPALANLRPEEIAGQDGQAIIDRLFDHVAETVAADHRTEVTSPDLDERVQQVLRALEVEGILQEVEDAGDHFRLKNAGCPFMSTAMETHACCAADRRTIELLLEMPVEQITTLADGAPQCEYLVPKRLIEDYTNQIAASAGKDALLPVVEATTNHLTTNDVLLATMPADPGRASSER